MEMSVINAYSDYSRGNLRHTTLGQSYEALEVSPHEEVMNTSGPHREMAIDVPMDYNYKRKEKPQLPPTYMTGTAPTPERRPQSGAFVRGVSAPYTPPPENTPHMSPQEQRQYQDRIKKYQADLSRRREVEERQQREEEFLRTSLRGSKKLQALSEGAQAPPSVMPTGYENPNFTLHESEETDDSVSRAATLPVRQQVHRLDAMLAQPQGVEEVFASLQAAQQRLRSPEDQQDLRRLSTLLTTPSFQRALKVHKSVVAMSVRSPAPEPVSCHGRQLLQEALTALKPGLPEVEQLRGLLSSPHIKSLLQVHDRVAVQKSVPTKSSPEDDEREFLYERASLYGEESIKIVRLQKTADPLGATVRNEADAVRIGRIVKGGIADKSGLLHEGDEILEINGIDIRNKSVNEVCDLMASLTGTLTFLINPSIDQHMGPKDEQLTHMRAHFDYDPEEDMYIPCKELGIGFVRGDILHVISREDGNWWQAYREGEEDQALAGLIPSHTFQLQRETIRRTMINEARENEKKKHRCHCGQSKKKLYDATAPDLEAEEILTYEEVARYYPQPNRKRPIVLIGPPFVGRQQLRERLMERDTDRFAAAVPHTSRPRQEGETDGKDYFFVARHVFEADVAEHKFVEYGEFEKHLFGTSMDSIHKVVNAGRICILNLQPQSLRILKASDLKPYIMFIAPPTIDKLKQLRVREGSTPSDNQLKDIIEKAREMEENFGHYFDYKITNFDHDRAYEELKNVIDQLEVEPQWVPAHWVT